MVSTPVPAGGKSPEALFCYFFVCFVTESPLTRVSCCKHLAKRLTPFCVDPGHICTFLMENRDSILSRCLQHDNRSKQDSVQKGSISHTAFETPIPQLLPRFSTTSFPPFPSSSPVGPSQYFLSSDDIPPDGPIHIEQRLPSFPASAGRAAAPLRVGR